MDSSQWCWGGQGDFVAVVFISYERTAQALMTRVREALRAAGHDVWTDDQLPPHRSYADVIEERLAAADAVIVLWSAGAARSQWVRAEAEHARAGGKLVQAVLDEVTPPLPFNQIQCAQLQKWSGDRNDPQWGKILESIDLLGGGRSEGPAAQRAPVPHKPWLGRLSGIWTATHTPPRLALLIAVVAVLIAGPLIWLAFHQGQASSTAGHQSGPALKLAVSPFTILGDSDASLRKFTGGLQAAMIDQLSRDQLNVIEPGQTSAAAYGFGGTIERDGDDLVVRARLADLRQHVTVWSEDFRRRTADADALQAEVANLAPAAAVVAVHDDALAKSDPETIGL